jgi:hypothetical protein
MEDSGVKKRAGDIKAAEKERVSIAKKVNSLIPLLINESKASLNTYSEYI